MRSALGKPLIKVLTGIRRCGKSSLLVMLEHDLIRNGEKPARILRINMESLEYDGLREYREMYRFVKDKLSKGGYFLLDEAQEVDGWERVVSSLLAESNIECIVTGSNASLLSSELGTLLTGRFMKIPIHTLSFPEFRTFSRNTKKDPDLIDPSEELLNRYLRIGGFPALHVLGTEEEEDASYLTTLLDSILMRDVVQRHSIRDGDALKRILAFAFDNIGNITSARQISRFWKSQGRTISIDTAVNYLNYLRDAFLLYRVQRFDIQGKQHLEYTEKYYAGDIGLCRGLLGNRMEDISGIVENVVFLELIRRGYAVSVGIIGNREIDFVARKATESRYYQVCVSLESEAVIEREFGALEAVKDQWPKTIIALYPGLVSTRSGIQVMSLEHFLNDVE